MTDVEINDIGYFKYESRIDSLVDCIKEYPITQDLIDSIERKELIFKIETQNAVPVEINGKYVILI